MENRSKVKNMAQLSLLTAIIIIMAFTPVGYLRIGFVEITFIMIPVVIGATVMGPLYGAILGGIFGLTSFIQCFGLSAFGMMILEASPIGAFVTCVIARVIAGWIPGMVFKLLNKKHGNSVLVYAISCITGSLANTVFFLGFLFTLLSGSMLNMANESGISMFQLMLSFISLNSLIELAVCAVIGTAVAKGVSRIIKRY